MHPGPGHKDAKQEKKRKRDETQKATMKRNRQAQPPAPPRCCRSAAAAAAVAAAMVTAEPPKSKTPDLPKAATQVQVNVPSQSPTRGQTIDAAGTAKFDPRELNIFKLAR